MRKLVVLFVCLALAGNALALSGQSPASASRTLVFGAAQAAYPGASQEQALTALQSSVGRSLAAVRVYDDWDTAFPNPYTSWLHKTGHAIVLSVRPKLTDGTVIPWASIARAKPGDPLFADMLRWAAGVKQFGGHVYLVFHHEPETLGSAGYGTPADFVAAWRTWVGVMRGAGVINAEYVWTVAESNFFVAPTDSRYAPRYYPGDSLVDDIAVDAYNMYCLRTDGRYQQPWRSLQAVLAPLLAFAALHRAPGLLLAEWASPEDPRTPGRKAQWLVAARQLLKQPAYSRLKAVLYWNQLSPSFPNCDFRVTSSASSLAAFTAMANDPFYSG